MERFNVASKEKYSKSIKAKKALQIALATHCSSFEDVCNFLLFARRMDKLNQPIKDISNVKIKKQTDPKQQHARKRFLNR